MAGTATMASPRRATDAPAALDIDTRALLPVYLRNLAALYRRDSGLAARIDAIPFCACPPLAPTRGGAPTVRLSDDSNREVYLHSRYDPLAEARQFVDA